MADTDQNIDIRPIENAFHRIDDGKTDFPTCSVAIEIQGVGSWIVKFSVSGVVVNNCDIVFAIEPKDCSARIHFKSHTVFWTTLNGGERFEDGVAKGYIKHTGLPMAIELVKRKMFSSEGGDNSRSDGTTTILPEKLIQIRIFTSIIITY